MTEPPQTPDKDNRTDRTAFRGRQDPFTWRDAAPVAGVLFAVLCLGLNRGLIFDEYKTRMVTELSWSELVRDRMGAGHLPTYFLMVKGWLELVPYSNWAMRVPGALFTALAVVPFILIGQRIVGRKGPLFIIIAFVLNQNVLWIGQTARPYGPLLFFEGLTVLAALQWWATGRRRWLLGAAGSALGGIVMMPLAGLVPVSLMLAAAAVRRRDSARRAWPLMAALGVALAIGFLPAAWVASSQSKLSMHREWHFPRLLKITDALPTMILGNYRLWARGGMQYVAQAVFVAMMVFALRRRWPVIRRRNNPEKDAPDVDVPDPAAAAGDIPWRPFLLFWIFAPLVALVLVSSFTGLGMVSHSRYQTPALGGVIVLFAVGLARLNDSLTSERVRKMVQGVVVAVLGITAVAWIRTPGEGVDVIAQRMIAESGGKMPAQVAGHMRWLRMELPEGEFPRREFFLERRPTRLNQILIEKASRLGHDVTVTDYEKRQKDVSELRERLGQWAGGEPFWLFVYIQTHDGLDRIKRDPPDGYHHRKTLKKGYARAYYFE